MGTAGEKGGKLEHNGRGAAPPSEHNKARAERRGLGVWPCTVSSASLVARARLHCSFVQCSFTSTETIRTIRDGEPRTSTSTFTQLLSSVCLSKLFCPNSKRHQYTQRYYSK